jgi:sulfur transfer protein SufE
MKLALWLLLLTACGTPRRDPAPADAHAEARVRAPVAGVASHSHAYQGADTGAWSVFGRSGPHIPQGFFIHMMDTNSEATGAMIVMLSRQGGRAVGVEVSAHGCQNRVWLNARLEGRSWNAAPARERSALAKAAVVRLARQAARECPADLSSLDDELRTFEAAFRAFDRARRFYGS